MYLQVETTFEHETPSAFLIKSSLIFPTFRRKNSKYVKIQKFNDYTFFSVEIFSLSWFLCTFDGVFRIRQRNKKSVEFFFLPLLIMNEVKPYASWAHKKLWFLIFMCKNEMRNHILVWKIIGTANWMRLLWKSLEFVSLSLRIRFLMSFQRNETAFFPPFNHSWAVYFNLDWFLYCNQMLVHYSNPTVFKHCVDDIRTELNCCEWSGSESNRITEHLMGTKDGTNHRMSEWMRISCFCLSHEM